MEVRIPEKETPKGKPIVYQQIGCLV